MIKNVVKQHFCGRVLKIFKNVRSCVVNGTHSLLLTLFVQIFCIISKLLVIVSVNRKKSHKFNDFLDVMSRDSAV